MSSWTVIEGEAIEQLATVLSASVDAIVTDPPYGIDIDGQRWDGPEIQEAAARAGDQSLDRGAAYGAWCRRWGAECLRVLKPGAFMLAFGFPRTSHRMICGLEDAGLEVCDTLCWLFADRPPKSRKLPGGRGTTLKPGHEPVVLLRRPVDGTTADNIDVHGTGGLELKACQADGRYPANVVLTHDSDCSTERCRANCPVPMIDIQTHGGRERPSRFYFRGRVTRRERDAGTEHLPAGGPRSVRNPHPTVKPLDLMRWLVRLVSPPGGLVLDPFCGSGSTGAAAVLEDRQFVGIEQDHGYVEIAEARIRHWAASRGEEIDLVPLGTGR
jgi:site-specific DNA-methyltransferase (adenine-specific)